jgi:hypothetical protein
LGSLALRRDSDNTDFGECALGEDTVKVSILIRPYELVRYCLHQQTGLSACTVADDNELATDLSHLEVLEK